MAIRPDWPEARSGRGRTPDSILARNAFVGFDAKDCLAGLLRLACNVARLWRAGRAGNLWQPEMEPFVGVSIADTATHSKQATQFQTAVQFHICNHLARHLGCSHYSSGGRGRYRNRQASFMTAPPLRAFRTTPRDPKCVELPASHLGKALTAEGFLDTDGEILIDGRVFGRVCADRLVLGSGGYLKGDVVARDVHIGGCLTGRIFALNVTLDSSADVTGRIFHHEVTVAKGARVDARMPWRPPSYFETLKQLPEPRP
jgi:cytoskeletal protein CcmA (bactofilin family)